MKHVLLLGDSIVSGQEDESGAGLAGRLGEAFPQTRFTAVSYPGAPTKLLLDLLSGCLDPERFRALVQRVGIVDLVIVVAGSNDYWFGGLPNRVAPRLWRLAALARVSFSSRSFSPWRLPAVAVASTQPVARPIQQQWIDESNKELLSRRLYPVVQFHRMDAALVGPDETHPSAAGYDRLAQITEAFLVGALGQERSVVLEDCRYEPRERIRVLREILQNQCLIPWGLRPQAEEIRKMRRGRNGGGGGEGRGETYAGIRERQTSKR